MSMDRVHDLLLLSLQLTAKTYKDSDVSLEVTFMDNGEGWVSKVVGTSAKPYFTSEVVFSFINRDEIFDELLKLAKDNEVLYGPCFSPKELSDQVKALL